jgi:hypothetical protein
MHTLIDLAWLSLALLHAAPAAVVCSPAALRRLYGVAPDGDVGVLLRHRGALFLAVLTLCLSAWADPAARAAAGPVVAISVLGYLAIYAAAGAPRGPLRTIAIADLLGVPALAVVLLAERGGAP